MAQMLGAIGNGAQSLFGTSALAGSSGASGGMLNGAMQSMAPSAMSNSMGFTNPGSFSSMMESMPMGAGGGMGLFGKAMEGAGFGSTDQAAASLGGMLGQSILKGMDSSLPQVSNPQMSGLENVMKQLGFQQKEWATPKYDTNSYINKLLSGVR